MPLTHGVVPMTVQVISLAVLLVAIGWRTTRWRFIWVPLMMAGGATLTLLVHWYIAYQGWAQDPAPVILWLWITLAGLAIGVVIVGWRSARWWRRGMSVLAVPLCLLCTALALNMWVGYFPTVRSAWNRVSGSQPSRWIDEAGLAQLKRSGVRPTEGVVVSVRIPDDASGFAHRTEYVYLPPAWFETAPPPKLPGVMMIGAEFARADDWIVAGDALKTLDQFAARHRGKAPVVVFVDSGGAFSNDTECVNGSRGNAADHLTKDVVPYVVSTFGVSSSAANWGVVGWSAGGTCSMTLSVMHPELFSAFIDIDGQYGPNAGTRQQTIARLFAGDTDAWAAFDPKTVVTQVGLFPGMSAWFAVSVDTPTVYRPGESPAVAPPAPDWDTNSEDHAVVANNLCSLLSDHGVECAVVSYAGSHDFPSAGLAFAAALPWLAGRIGTPGVRPIPMPGASPGN
jgi:S-formylglutathione hydrolase FrmB